MPDHIIHLEQALLLPVTQQEYLSLSLTFLAFLHYQSKPFENLQPTL